jgi:hypothetical protein
VVQHVSCFLYLHGCGESEAEVHVDVPWAALKDGRESRPRSSLRIVKGEVRGCGRPLALVLSLGLRGLDGPRLLGLCLLGHRGPPERLTNQYLEMPVVS